MNDHLFDLPDLQAIRALCVYRHFGRAAAALAISQPALTKRIQLLEQRLGSRLFERSRQGASPTPAGECLSGHAQAVLASAEIAQDAVHAHILGHAGTLRLGAGLAVLLGKLPQTIARFQQRFPLVRVSVNDLPTKDQLAMLLDGRLDLAFPRLPLNLPGISVKSFSSEELAWAVHSRHPRRLDKLFAHPLLLLHRFISPTFHDHVLAVCHKAGHSPHQIREANQVLTILSLVEAGVGFSLLPISLKKLRFPNVRFVQVEDPIAAWEIGVAWRNSNSSPIVGNLLAFLR